jgi:putative Holliday junction resolvase
MNFIDRIKSKIKVPIKLWDERLTTLMAERILEEGGLNWRKRRKVIDKLSAAMILQSYLDSLRVMER